MMILFILLLLLMTNSFQCAVYCGAESVDDHIDVVWCRDVGRCEQDMVAAAAIHGPAGRVTGDAAFECGGLDPLVELEAGIERLPAGGVGDHLEGPEHDAPPDIPPRPG